MDVQLKSTVSPTAAVTRWGWNVPMPDPVVLPPTVMTTVLAEERPTTVICHPVGQYLDFQPIAKSRNCVKKKIGALTKAEKRARACIARFDGDDGDGAKCPCSTLGRKEGKKRARDEKKAAEGRNRRGLLTFPACVRHLCREGPCPLIGWISRA